MAYPKDTVRRLGRFLRNNETPEGIADWVASVEADSASSAGERATLTDLRMLILEAEDGFRSIADARAKAQSILGQVSRSRSR